VIRVTDSGTGISKEMAEQIVQPFYTTKKRGESTGIGLAVSMDILNDHGGKLNIDTECKNTRFEILLPIHRIVSSSNTSLAS
jgi:two-component system C4-dicarboxylate transport sensor histidine kinase DctB